MTIYRINNKKSRKKSLQKSKKTSLSKKTLKKLLNLDFTDEISKERIVIPLNESDSTTKLVRSRKIKNLNQCIKVFFKDEREDVNLLKINIYLVKLNKKEEKIRSKDKT